MLAKFLTLRALLGKSGGTGGGLTAEEVQAMIDATLGGIENGTY